MDHAHDALGTIQRFRAARARGRHECTHAGEITRSAPLAACQTLVESEPAAAPDRSQPAYGANRMAAQPVARQYLRFVALSDARPPDARRRARCFRLLLLSNCSTTRLPRSTKSSGCLAPLLRPGGRSPSSPSTAIGLAIRNISGTGFAASPAAALVAGRTRADRFPLRLGRPSPLVDQQCVRRCRVGIHKDLAAAHAAELDAGGAGVSRSWPSGTSSARST